MEDRLYQNHLAILRSELIVAMGCTEPIAIAYAAAKAREVLGKMPERCRVRCSGNMIKNVKGVTVPASGGMRGIEVAAILGVVGGDARRELAVLQTVTPEHQKIVQRLLAARFCTCELAEGVENLYVEISLSCGGESACVEIREHHTNLTRIVKNGAVLLQKEQTQKEAACEGDRMLLSVQNILEFADCVKLEDVESLLSRQLAYNTAIAKEGLSGNWGACVGKMLLSRGEQDIRLMARAYAAAGSDARMGGCAMPVVINSGSGNQGLAITMPLVVYADALKSTKDKLLRALALANLISVHQKKYIGSLSAYCGAVSAACGAACGVAYLMEKEKVENAELLRIISDTITNSICTIGGMVCDGAKGSCAAKISVAVENALQALEMSLGRHVFRSGEGLVMPNVEQTIQAVGRMGRVGMRTTDVEILHIMLEN